MALCGPLSYVLKHLTALVSGPGLAKLSISSWFSDCSWKGYLAGREDPGPELSYEEVETWELVLLSQGDPERLSKGREVEEEKG